MALISPYLLMPPTNPNWFNFSVWGAAGVIPMWRGGREAVVLGVMSQATVAQYLIFPATPDNYISLHLTEDVFFFGIIIWCILTARAYWIVWMGSAGLFLLASYAVKLASPQFSLSALLVLERMVGLIYLTLLIYGGTRRETSPRPTSVAMFA
jgi:hypothetical protein